MTEKRSDYRKKHKQRKRHRFLNDVKASFSDRIDNGQVDVNPDFQRPPEEKEAANQQADNLQQEDIAKKVQLSQEPQVNDKGLRLKKKLNLAIIIVFLLILAVLFALFHL